MGLIILFEGLHFKYYKSPEDKKLQCIVYLNNMYYTSCVLYLICSRTVKARFDHYEWASKNITLNKKKHKHFMQIKGTLSMYDCGSYLDQACIFAL